MDVLNEMGRDIYQSMIAGDWSIQCRDVDGETVNLYILDYYTFVPLWAFMRGKATVTCANQLFIRGVPVLFERRC